jgi:hypothetical protein
MSCGAQVIEKNRFPDFQNRSNKPRMENDAMKSRNRLLLILMALTLAAAILAPMAVLAG